MKNLPKFVHQHYDSWFDVAGIVTLAAVAAFAFAEYPADDPRRWVAAGIVILFWLTLIRTFTQEDRIKHEYIRLATLTGLAVLLFALGSNPFAVVVLFFCSQTRSPHPAKLSQQTQSRNLPCKPVWLRPRMPAQNNLLSITQNITPSPIQAVMCRPTLAFALT